MASFKSSEVTILVTGTVLWLTGLFVVVPISGRFALSPLVQFVVFNAPGWLGTLTIEFFGQWSLILVTASVTFTILLGVVLIAVIRPRGFEPKKSTMILFTFLVTASLFTGTGLPISPLLFLYTALSMAPLFVFAFIKKLEGPDNSRRIFLKQLGGGIGAATVVGLSSKFITEPSSTDTPPSDRSSKNTTRARSRKPRPSRNTDEFGFGFEGMPSQITSINDHYIVDKNNTHPVVNNWALDFRGAVENSLSMSLGDLRTHNDVTSRIVTMECISNPIGGQLIGTAEWTGVPLKSLLDQAQIHEDTRDIVTLGLDAYSEAIPVDRVQSRDILLAFEMNGQPLPPEHGSPMRLLIPGRYGFRSTKWVSEVRPVTEEHDAFWEKRGWDEEAIVNTLSYIRAIQRRGDRVAIGGVAYAGLRGIYKVEISIDGGQSWEIAELEDPPSELAWRRWRYITDRLSPSTTFEAVVRATDGEENLQTKKRSDPHPGGSTGWHHRSFTI